MARRRAFAGSSAAHRSDASFNSKEARRFAQRARMFARSGDCRNALHSFGVAAFYAGIAVGNRKWAGGKRGKLHRGGSKLGSRINALQNTVLRACRVG